MGMCPASDGIRLVQLRLRLGLVPVRPRRDVLQFRFEEVVQELLLGVLRLGEALARGRWASLPVARLSRSRGLERLLGFSFERFHRTVREYRKGRGKDFLGPALVSMRSEEPPEVQHTLRARLIFVAYPLDDEGR